MQGMKRLFPSSFNPNDPALHGVPRAAQEEWSALEHALISWGAKRIMLRLPLFWQVEIPVFRACRASGAFLFTNDVRNMPLGKYAVRAIGIDTVVTDIDDASEFSAFLLREDTPVPPHWFIVRPAHRAGTPLPRELAGVAVEEEVHLSPGIPAPRV